MSTTYHAAAIVGCKIDKSEIFSTRETRLCEHLLLRENAKFCSECGKKTWEHKQIAIPQYDRNKRTLCGFRVFCHWYEDSIIVASDFTEADNYSEEPGPKMINAFGADGMMRESLMIALKPHGLWKPDAFGIWVAQWCS